MGAEAEERWNEIVEAAGAIFYKKGYEATSLQDIASAVGLLKGSVYYYIRTKEDILFELLRRALDQFERTAEEDEVTAKSPAPERLRAFISRWMGLSARSREWNLVAEREFTRLSQPNLRAVIDRRDRLNDFLKSIIQAGIEEGAFDPTTDLSVAAAAIFELMRSSHAWHRPGGRLSWQDVGSWYATFAIRGLGGPDWAADHGEPLKKKR
jgi:AcrR family transcriptional regulator